jgi:hypothetical protein
MYQDRRKITMEIRGKPKIADVGGLRLPKVLKNMI